jgi:hypothetical protein
MGTVVFPVDTVGGPFLPLLAGDAPLPPWLHQYLRHCAAHFNELASVLLWSKHHPSHTPSLLGFLHVSPEPPPLFWAVQPGSAFANKPASASANETTTIREIFIIQIPIVRSARMR